tara:strand:+ start:531 stop:710 length:180 start_codon:yes stop_codon:yes gene_type:complete
MSNDYEDNLKEWLEEKINAPCIAGGKMVFRRIKRKDHFKKLKLSKESVEELYCEKNEGD